MTKKAGPSQPYSIPADRPRACCPRPPPPPSRSARRRPRRARAPPRPPRPRLSRASLLCRPVPATTRRRHRWLSAHCEPRPRPAALAPAGRPALQPGSGRPRVPCSAPTTPAALGPAGARPRSCLAPSRPSLAGRGGHAAPPHPAVPDEAGCPWSGRRAPPAAGQQ
ncbi:actin-binding protein wsp1-like [Miscanthus floridulus]|uniref:actin-binding protein wsp1-like n=1 Tax=Miscanthus floridulus TaxID=154761 RepID=UPI00345942B4